jgi:hypothetical protein
VPCPHGSWSWECDLRLKFRNGNCAYPRVVWSLRSGEAFINFTSIPFESLIGPFLKLCELKSKSVNKCLLLHLKLRLFPPLNQSPFPFELRYIFHNSSPHRYCLINDRRVFELVPFTAVFTHPVVPDYPHCGKSPLSCWKFWKYTPA